MSNRRFWLSLGILVTLLLAGVILLASLTHQRTAQQEILNNRSIYNAQSSGYKAWFLALQESGIHPHVWRLPFRKLDQIPEPSVMLVVEPYTAVNNQITIRKADIQALLEWVEAGNTLVFLDTFKRASTGLLLQSLNIPEPHSLPLETAKKQKQDVQMLHNAALFYNSKHPWLSSYLRGKLETGSPVRLPDDFSDHVLLRDEQERPVLQEVSYGQGKVILGTTPDLASNSFLHQKTLENYQFLTNLLLRERKPLYINEYIHGYGLENDIFSYYSKTPLGKMLAQLLFGFVFLLWLSALRWRPSQKLSPGPARHYTLEYLRSLAHIYMKAQAASLVLAPQLQRIERLLQTRYRSSLQLGWAENSRLHTLLADLAPDSLQSLEKAQTVVSQQKKLSATALLKLSQQLMVIEERLRHGNPYH